jgi:cytochrome o ubiquinol oxidase subunit IV
MSIRNYIIGFALSIALTFAAFALASHPLYFGNLTLAALVLLAVGQLFVQLIFFLHIREGEGRGWNITVLLFALLIVGIVVFGSLWIMRHLNHNMHPSAEEIVEDEALTPYHEH